MATVLLLFFVSLNNAGGQKSTSKCLHFVATKITTAAMNMVLISPKEIIIWDKHRYTITILRLKLCHWYEGIWGHLLSTKFKSSNLAFFCLLLSVPWIIIAMADDWGPG